MSTTSFRKVDRNLNGLIESIRLGSIAVPEIQRPFVWPSDRADPVLNKEYVAFRDPDNVQWEFYIR